MSSCPCERQHCASCAVRVCGQCLVTVSVVDDITCCANKQTHQLIFILYRRFMSRSNGHGHKKNLRSIEEGVQSTEGENEEDTLATFVANTGRNASRSALAVITGGIGAAVGTAVRPGVGTMIGGTLGDSIAYVLF